MEWLSENWVWVLVGIAFIAMHMFGHGGHGGHGNGGTGGKVDRGAAEQSDAPPEHRH